MPQFSRNTIVELMEASEFDSTDDIELFLIKFYMEEDDITQLGMVRYLIQNPEKTGPFGGNVVAEIVEYLIETRCRYPLRDPEEMFPRLMRALKHDGYVIEEGKLTPIVSET